VYVEHCFSPVFDNHSRLLILGTMPSPASREQGFYYSHPRNRFWAVMTAVTGAETCPQTPEEKRAFALAHRFALWDVLRGCEIEGASDASIRQPVPNNLDTVLSVAPIEAICTTGGTALRLYRQFNRERSVPVIALPSTSPANARMPLEELIEHYECLREYLR